MEDESGKRVDTFHTKKAQKILPYGRRALLPGISPRSNSASDCAIQNTLVNFQHDFNLNWVHTCDTI
jgi:hypothetical protein